MGRPTKYTQELADQICEAIATSDKGLRYICKKLNLNHYTVLLWLRDDKHDGFINQYARAKEQQADYMAEQIISIADKCRLGKKIVDKPTGLETTESDMVDRSRLMIDARKWLAGKLAPKKYGDKVDVTSGGDKIVNIPITQWVNSDDKAK